MTYRRRHRWLRRLVVGLAFATFAAPAAAKVDQGTGGWSPQVDPAIGTALAAAQSASGEYTPFVSDFPQTAVSAEPRIVIPYLSHGIGVVGDATGIRPDDRADRFAHSDVQPRVELASSNWELDRDVTLSVGIGAFALALGLGLGLALGSRRRTMLAGH